MSDKKPPLTIWAKGAFRSWNTSPHKKMPRGDELTYPDGPYVHLDQLVDLVEQETEKFIHDIETGKAVMPGHVIGQVPRSYIRGGAFLEVVRRLKEVKK